MNGQKSNKCKKCEGSGYIVCPICHGKKETRTGTSTNVSKGTTEITKGTCVKCKEKGTK